MLSPEKLDGSQAFLDGSGQPVSMRLGGCRVRRCAGHPHDPLEPEFHGRSILPQRALAARLMAFFPKELEEQHGCTRGCAREFW